MAHYNLLTHRTSTAALKSLNVNHLQAKVLNFLRDCGEFGATDEEMQLGIPMKGNTQRPRRIELFLDGLIVYSGTDRANLSGRKAAVWKIKGV